MGIDRKRQMSERGTRGTAIGWEGGGGITRNIVLSCHLSYDMEKTNTHKQKKVEKSIKRLGGKYGRTVDSGDYHREPACCLSLDFEGKQPNEHV